MTLKTKEHLEIMIQFEKKFSNMRLDKEQDKSLWEKGSVYESGETNRLFLVFRSGYSFGRLTERLFG